MIEHLVQGAKEMEINNKKLEARLSASKQEIEQLQQNLEAVRTESLTDPLTTLSNRKFSMPRWPRPWPKPKRRTSRCRC